MHAIETQTVTKGGQSYRIAIYLDDDAPNPLEDCDELGRILSLNRRHRHFDPDGIETALASNPDALPLSYFEHGLCRWSVAGELPAACHCPWDSVAFAGLWLPDASTLESARHCRGAARRRFMRTRARQACDVYTAWCNGEVYGYEVSRIVPCSGCEPGRSEPLRSCWGYYDLDECRDAAIAEAGK
jgi:hypothetical protein